MKIKIISVLSACLILSACGGGSGGGTSGAGSSISSGSNGGGSSSSAFPELPIVDQANPELAMNFYIKNAPVDLREITLEQAWAFGSDSFVEAWKYYHHYHAPKTIIENWVSPDSTGLGVYPLRINVDGDLGYLTVSKLFTADNVYEAGITSVNFMKDSVDNGEYCFVNSAGNDFNAAINQENLRVGAEEYKPGAKLTFIPAYDNSLFAGVDVPKAPKMAIKLGEKNLVFFFNHNPELDQQDGRYVIGVFYNGQYYTEVESNLSFESNGYVSEFVDHESKIAINLRTTRFETGATTGLKTESLIECVAEPISRSGLELNKIYATEFDTEGTVATAYIHIASDGLISSFTDDIENLDNCLNTGALSRKNGQMHGAYAQYNRDGHYIFIKDSSFKTFRLLLDENNAVNSIWAFNANGQAMTAPTFSYVDQFNAISINVSDVALSDLQAAVCSPQN